MELPLWDPPDGQGPDTFFAGQSGNDNEDHWMCDFSFGYERDVIEEDILNGKSCLQVLRILTDKADEEIMKLEEDIAMLQCRLAWDDEDWSKQCSAALIEKIDNFEILIQSLKKEIAEGVHSSALRIEQPEKFAQRLHDLLKPLLESYLLAKSKQNEQTDGRNEKKFEPSASERNEKVEVMKCINLVKQIERKNLSVRAEERKINRTQQKDTNKLNSIYGKRTPISSPVKSGMRSSIKPEPSDSIVKASSSVASTPKAGSGKRERKVPGTVKLEDEILEMDCEQRIGEALTEIRKARRAINKKDLLPMAPTIIQRKTTKPPEIETFKINREGQRPQKKPKATLKTVQSIHQPEEMDIKPSPIENLTGKPNFGAPVKITKNEMPQEVNVTSISSPRKIKESSFSSHGIAEEVGVGKSSLACMKDVDRLTLKDLRIIAKNQKLRGYHKLRKKELQERLGLEDPSYLQQKAYDMKGASPANTV